MTLREKIVADIQNLPESALPKLQETIEQLREKDEPGFLRRLQKIKIQAPPDFSTNFDLYANGEKDVESNIR